MPPLTRQRTLESVLSWWSDSNPGGATINLHAAAKPLMKLLYHREALAFVKRNQGVPLTTETVEIYSSYLFESDVNDVALGFDLLWYIAYSSEGAEGVVAANALPYLLDGLGSPSSSVRWRACQLMQVLAEHESTAAAVIELHPCKHLVSLSRQVTAGTAEVSYASDALVAIANWPDGAEAIVAARPEM
ncbi:hypothetical protein FB451DRAFT_1551287, partial [Mycena latifolia]